jgi:hypothetical protein
MQATSYQSLCVCALLLAWPAKVALGGAGGTPTIMHAVLAGVTSLWLAPCCQLADPKSQRLQIQVAIYCESASPIGVVVM